MNPFIFAAVLTFAAGRAFASEPASALDALKALTGKSAALSELKAPAPKPAPGPASIKWDYQTVDIDSAGRWPFEWKGKKYAVKLLFMRGAYDTYVKTFKARPYFCLQDITDPAGALTWPYRPLDGSEAVNFYFENEGWDDYLSVARNGGNLTVSACDKDDKCSELLSFAARLLYEDWRAMSKDRALPVAGRKLFLVPQLSYDGETMAYGYVISENSPLYFTTGMPQDYVQLFRDGSDGFYDFRPKAYSLATKLVFEMAPPAEGDIHPSWTVREMDGTEIQEALDEMLANRSRIPLLPAGARKPVKAGK